MKSLWARIALVLVGVPVLGSLFSEEARATTIHPSSSEQTQAASEHEEHEAIYFVGCGGFF